jgi:hypothetical protein
MVDMQFHLTHKDNLTPMQFLKNCLFIFFFVLSPNGFQFQQNPATCKYVSNKILYLNQKSSFSLVKKFALSKMAQLDESLRDKLTEVKPVIRSILLALGKRANEREFRREYFNNEGESFNVFLFGFGLSFYDFMIQIPDVVRVWKIRLFDGAEEVLLERVSTEGSSHMDNLTVTTKKKKKPMPRFR